MQPYFLPYAGYFRLFAAVDEFVIYDCVQFPRRGRVHRTRVPGPAGPPEWLTLPIARQPTSTLIRDLEFHPKARALFDQRLQRLSWLRSARGPAADQIREHLFGPLECVIDYLQASLRIVLELTGLSTPIVRSSSLHIDASCRGESRVLAVARARQATHYVNAPGGRQLYNAAEFAKQNLSLSFLNDYSGPFKLLLPALVEREPAEIRADIKASADIVR